MSSHPSRKRCRIGNKSYASETFELEDCTVQRQMSSPHFLRSPSSALGAVESLGTLIDVLSNDKKCFCFKCKRRVEPFQMNELIVIVSNQFSMCHEFVRKFQFSSTAAAAADAVVTGLRLLNNSLIAAVSHLCPFNCFLKAFAPARKWYSLRSNIFHIGNTSPDKVLKGWTCCLCNVDKQPNIHNGRNMIGSKPKVNFIAPNGERFESEDSVLKALGLVQNVKSNNKRTLLKAMKYPATTSTDPDRSIIESEIIAGRPLYGISCTRTELGGIMSLKRSNRSLHEALDEKVSTVDQANFTKNNNISPFGLLEELFVHDPWRLLISTILLNRTCREQVDFVMYQLLDRFPNSQSLANADVAVVSEILQPIGIRYRRAETLVRFSHEYNRMLLAFAHSKSKVEKTSFSLSRKDILGLYGCGQYAADAYEIFIMGKYEDVNSSDHALRYYIEYKRGISRIL